MLAEYKTKTNVGVGIGIVLQIIANVITRTNPDMFVLGLIVGLVGSVLFIFGCCCYAIGKGYHGALGLLGLLSCLGLIVLVVLPDKNK